MFGGMFRRLDIGPSKFVTLDALLFGGVNTHLPPRIIAAQAIGARIVVNPLERDRP